MSHAVEKEFAANVCSITGGWVSFLPAFSQMKLRAETSPWLYCHDGGVLQTELAIGKILNGTNPYGSYYKELEDWDKDWEDNPSTFHTAYPGSHPQAAHGHASRILDSQSS